ncbi:MAG: hypothetical protein AB1450_14770 [Pseudomonadota bacterium]
MQFHVEPTACGFSLALGGEHFRAPPCELRYPSEVWQAYPAKAELIRELAYITTLATPLILEHPRVSYDTPEPLLFERYRALFAQAVPNLVEAVPEHSSSAVLARFQSLQHHFAPATPASPLPQQSWHPRRAVLPLSFGKDSLLSLATLRRLGYEVIPVNIDERMLPRGTRLREPLVSHLRGEHGLDCLQLVNEIQLLSDHEVLKTPPTRLYQVQVHFIYALAMLPFCSYFGAPLVVLSNELLPGLDKVQREGYLLPQRYMQGEAANLEMDRMVQDLSGGQVRAVNPIGALGNLAIHTLLHRDFAEFGSYQVSCHLEVTPHTRWCHDCERCSHAYLYFRALGLDPYAYGFVHSLLDGGAERHFVAAGPAPHAEDAYRRFLRGEERLAAWRARQRGAEHPAWTPAQVDEAMDAPEYLLALHRQAHHPLEAEAHALYQRLLRCHYAG